MLHFIVFNHSCFFSPTLFFTSRCCGSSALMTRTLWLMLWTSTALESHPSSGWRGYHSSSPAWLAQKANLCSTLSVRWGLNKQKKRQNPWFHLPMKSSEQLLSDNHTTLSMLYIASWFYFLCSYISCLDACPADLSSMLSLASSIPFGRGAGGHIWLGC